MSFREREVLRISSSRFLSRPPVLICSVWFELIRGNTQSGNSHRSLYLSTGETLSVQQVSHHLYCKCPQEVKFDTIVQKLYERKLESVRLMTIVINFIIINLSRLSFVNKENQTKNP